MLNWLSTWFNRVRSGTQHHSTLSTRLRGNNNNVVNIVVHGGGLVPLPMRTTIWTETPQDLGSVAALLRWNTRLAPLLGRETELAQLHAWVESDYPISIQLLHAPGGQGKTRLAAEFATKLEGWRHGWVDLADFSQADTLTWQGRCLLLVDYPEHQPNQLERLAQAVERAATSSPGLRLRILLVARDAQGIQTVLQQRACAAWLMPPLALVDLPDSSGHPLVQAALDRLSVLLDRPPVPLALDDVAHWRTRHPLHHSPLLGTALAIHLAHQPELQSLPDRWLTGTDLLARLVEHETRWWENTAAGHGAPAGALTTVMVWATLSGTLTDGDINQTLAPGHGWSLSDQTAIHAALRAACRRVGEHGWAPVEPDLLAAHFIDRWLADPMRQGREAAEGALACALLRIHDRVVFRVHLNRLHMLAYDQTARLGLRLAQDDNHRLESVLWAWAVVQPTLLLALGVGLNQRPGWPGLARLAVQVSQAQVANLGPAASEAQRAQELNNLSVRLSETGDLAGALAPVQEAVTIYRRLAKTNPQAFEPYLASGLNNLSIRLSETGDRVGALDLAQEAVTIHRRLAQANPQAFEPGLAGSLNNLASRLSEIGDRVKALAPAQETVTIRRSLAQTNPGAYEPDLAGSLNNLSIRLSETGERAEALALAQETVTIRRRLAQANPSAYEPDLAASLHNLSIRLSETGDRAGALTLAHETVMIHRRLAQTNPAAYEPDLAASLNNLASRMSEIGGWVEALVPAQETVTVYRRLAQTIPGTYEPNLAGSLCNLSIRRSETGDRGGALAPAKEAVTIFRRLAQANPGAYESDLAASLNNLANRLIETGDRVEALVLAKETVTMYHRLAQANPGAYEPDLAGSLHNLANFLSAIGDRAGARTLTQEAVTIRRRLAQANPGAYEPDLAGSLNNLANFLSAVGDRAGALVPIQEAVTIRRRLAQANPGAYEPELAMSLGTMMLCQAAAGYRPEALAAGAEALRLFTALAERLPNAFGAYRDMTQRHMDGLSAGN